MAGTEEQAQVRRGLGSTFPAEWGVPPGRQYSEERARWIVERVREHQALTAVRRRAREVSRTGGEHTRRAQQLLMRRRDML
ncbi:hypothetical protein [Streptomyces sp. NPDC047928]|uniref:hypothetical protein n=1 Tax=unclassified Streptomyces TaxID=2593676 RepID=UPI003713599F